MPFLIVTEWFDLAFSFHSVSEAFELLYVHYLFGFVQFCVFGSFASFVLFDSMFYVCSVSSVIASIFAEEDVDIVCHQSSTHVYSRPRWFLFIVMQRA